MYRTVIVLVIETIMYRIVMCSGVNFIIKYQLKTS